MYAQVKFYSIDTTNHSFLEIRCVIFFIAAKVKTGTKKAEQGSSVKRQNVRQGRELHIL